MNITKEQALEKIKELEKYISEKDIEEKKVVGIAIKTRLGSLIFQSTKSTYKEAIIEKGDANLRNADLRNADLSDANLIDADLSDADLSNADLRNANLIDANLRNADLRNADLRGANLIGAELMNAKFKGKTTYPVILKQNQVTDFLTALGFKVE